MHSRRLGTLGLALLALLTARQAGAAEATDVLDAIDGDDLFDANIELSYQGHAKRAKITREDVRQVREGNQTVSRAVDVSEFMYVEHSHTVVPRLRVGLFQDIEIFMALPYTALDHRLGWYQRRNDLSGEQSTSKEGYSTFVRDMCLYGHDEGPGYQRPEACAAEWEEGEHRNTLAGTGGSWPVNHEYETDSDGKPIPGEQNGRDTNWDINPGATGITPAFQSVRGAASYRVVNGFQFFPKGIGDAELGFAFSPFSIGRFNDKRDPAMPSMRMEFKYQIPVGWMESPTSREKLGGTTENFDPGGTGSGLHRLTAAFAMSKQLKLFDPYFGAHYTLGIPQYRGDLAPERDWRDFAFWSNRAGVMGGVEVVPLYSLGEINELVNLRLILGGRLNYIAKHRGPSEMSDALNKWTMVDSYVEIFGNVGVVLAVPFVMLKANVEVGHETPHLITGEVAGYDTDGNGISKSERNPYYNPVLDAPGRRVKVTESQVVNGMLQLAVTF
ncbi:MAG: hypothetical protein AB2A00_25320 [Myxococcota bacterium]